MDFHSIEADAPALDDVSRSAATRIDRQEFVRGRVEGERPGFGGQAESPDTGMGNGRNGRSNPPRSGYRVSMSHARSSTNQAAWTWLLLGAMFLPIAAADDAPMNKAPGGATAPGPGESAPAEDSILRGPSVPDDLVRTLVSQDMAGRFQRVEGRPEVAALQLLQLSPETRRAAVMVVEARASSIRDFLIDHIDEIKESTDAAAAGDNKKAERMRRELYERFEPDRARDPLVEPLSKVLSSDESAELKRLLDEYWAAWVDAESNGAPVDKREAMQRRFVGEIVQNEFRSAYEYTLRPIQRRLDRIAEVVEPTPEQRQAIRLALIAYVKESRLRPTPEQRLALSRAIYEAIDEEQRIKLLAASIGSE